MNTTVKDPDRDAIVARWKIEKDLKGTGALDSPCYIHSGIMLPPLRTAEHVFIMDKYEFEKCVTCGWLISKRKKPPIR